jgi:hypothetical protein
MGDIKPLGSEKLSGDEKLKRILELTYYNNNNNKNVATSKAAEYLSESTKSGLYGVVKEKDGYYVKRGLNENSLDYIGGMFMKNKNRFSSYAEALKRLELLKGQDNLQEETKYVLKAGKSAPAEVAPPAPAEVAAEMPPALPPASPDMGAAPDMGVAPDMGAEMGAAPDMGAEPEMGGEEGGDDKLKVVQKLTGKLGQKIRDIQDDLESDDIKYIINSVLSAVNLDKLEMDDKEEILSKFEDEEDFEGEDGLGDTEGGEELPSEMPAPEAGDESELGEMDGIDALENLVNMSFDEGFDDFDTQIQPEEMGFDDEFEDEGPVGRHDALDSNIDLEKEKVRKKTKHFVEPDSEEDLYFRQASMDSDNYDSDADIFGDDEYGDMFNFDLKEEDPMGDESELESLFNKELDMAKSMEDEKEDGFDNDAHLAHFDRQQYGDMDEVVTKEVDINELTDMINNSVKETLRKHFEQ